MSEEGAAKISNIEVLLDKVLGFQGQLTNVKEVLSTIDVTERPGAGLKRFATESLQQPKQKADLDPEPSTALSRNSKEEDQPQEDKNPFKKTVSAQNKKAYMSHSNEQPEE